MVTLCWPHTGCHSTHMRSAGIKRGEKKTTEMLTVAASTFCSQSRPTHTHIYTHLVTVMLRRAAAVTVSGWWRRHLRATRLFLPTVVPFLWKPQRSQRSHQEHHSDLWRPRHNSQRCRERLKETDVRAPQKVTLSGKNSVVTRDHRDINREESLTHCACEQPIYKDMKSPESKVALF